MKIMKKDITPNKEVTTFFALDSLRLKKSRDQRNYLALTLYDKTGRLNGYLWESPLDAATSLREKTLVKVRGIATKVNGSLIMNVEKIRAAERGEVDITDFLEVVPGGIDLWHGRLLTAAENMRDVNCRRLIQAFLDDRAFMDVFLKSPAGLIVHHSYVGGLLEHTVSSMELAAQFADRHPGLIDRDLIQVGAFLHDIGKIREIHWEIAREYTTEGKLLGHITLGIMMLEEKLLALEDFPEELANRLRHMVVSHHGSREHGSAVRPATPEAWALHLIEAADAKINHLYCHLQNSDAERAWSSYDRILETEIYQKRLTLQTEEKSAAAA